MHLYLEYEPGWDKPYLAFLIDFRARESGSMCSIGTAEETYEKLVQAIAPLLVRCPEPIQRHYQNIQPFLEQLPEIPSGSAKEKLDPNQIEQGLLGKLLQQASVQPGHA